MNQIFRPLGHALLLVLLVAGVSACSDSSGPDGGDDYTSWYQPLSIGSEWEYTGSSTRSTLVGDTTIDGKRYVIAQSEMGTSSYIRREGDDYLQLGYFGSMGTEPILTLKEAPAGTEWTVEYSDPTGTTPNRGVLKVEAYLDSHTVRNLRFHDVLHVTGIFEARVPGGNWQQYATADYYYARGIGLIESTFGGALNGQSQKIKSFNVVGSTAMADTVGDGQTQNGNEHLTASIDGAAWTGSGVRFISDFTKMVTANSGSGSTFSSLSVATSLDGTGTASLDQPPFNGVMYMRGSNTIMSQSGSVTITRNDDEIFEGTFSATLTDGTQITNGTFRVEK